MTDFATFIIPALLVFGIGSFLTVFGIALARHLRWSRRFRKRIGSYTS